jgi:hypothetical protein
MILFPWFVFLLQMYQPLERGAVVRPETAKFHTPTRGIVDNT